MGGGIDQAGVIRDAAGDVIVDAAGNIVDGAGEVKDWVEDHVWPF